MTKSKLPTGSDPPSTYLDGSLDGETREMTRARDTFIGPYRVEVKSAMAEWASSTRRSTRA